MYGDLGMGLLLLATLQGAGFQGTYTQDAVLG
jgi:hypothetical protein